MSGEASDGGPGGNGQGPAIPDTAPDPSVEWGEDATSGRRFVRWNAVTLALGLAFCAGGVAALRAAPPAPWVGVVGSEVWRQPEVARYAVGGLEPEPGADVDELTRSTSLQAEPRALLTTAVWRGGELGEVMRLECAFSPDDPRRVREVRAVILADLALARLSSTGAGWLLGRLPQGTGGWRRERLRAATPEDALPLLVRLVDWEATPELDLPLVPSLALRTAEDDAAPGAAAAGRGVLSARIRAVGRERVEVRAGVFNCVRVSVEVEGEQRSRFWVGLGQNRPLVRFADPIAEYRLVELRADGP